MKKLVNFLFSFSLFYALVTLLCLGAVAFLYLAICFISWDFVGLDNLTQNALFSVRLIAVVVFMITTKWIFTEGRREWDYR